MNIDNKIVELADRIAEKAHFGQFRWGGVIPYIEHPRAVRNIAVNLLQYEGWSAPTMWEGYQDWVALTVVQAVSLLHDTVEDCDVTLADLTIAGIEAGFDEFELTLWNEVIDAVALLTKNPDKQAQSYFEYLTALKSNIIARIVKIADITHNLSDLKAGSMKDKYELARWFLNNDPLN